VRALAAPLTLVLAALAAATARRGEIAKQVTDVRGRLSQLLDVDLAQLKKASEGALSQADAIQQSLQSIEAADTATKTEQPEAAAQAQATN
jgi:hypothetical protein